MMADNDVKYKWNDADEAFVTGCSGFTGDCMAAEFRKVMDGHFVLCGSPAEKLFLAAFVALVDANSSIPCGRVIELPQGLSASNGCKIHVQEWMSPKDRVDFHIRYFGDVLLWNTSQYWQEPDKPMVDVVVEIDGKDHQSAAKIEEDNKRDRYLQSRGCEIFRSTAKAVNADPMKVALECLCFITGKEASAFICPDIRRVWKPESVA